MLIMYRGVARLSPSCRGVWPGCVSKEGCGQVVEIRWVWVVLGGSGWVVVRWVWVGVVGLWSGGSGWEWLSSGWEWLGCGQVVLGGSG